MRRGGDSADSGKQPDPVPVPEQSVRLESAVSLHAQPYCQRQAFDPEVPVGLKGEYGVVGKAAGSAKKLLASEAGRFL